MVTPGTRLNIKTALPSIGGSHYKDETVVKPSYLYNELGNEWEFLYRCDNIFILRRPSLRQNGAVREEQWHNRNLFILNYMFKLSVLSSSDSANAHPHGCFYRGVPGFTIDCHGGVRCRGLTTCPLHVGPLFGNQVWNDSGFVSLIQWRTTFSPFLMTFYIYLNAAQYDNTVFSFTLFSCTNNVLFLHSTSILSFDIDVVLTLSTWHNVSHGWPMQ